MIIMNELSIALFVVACCVWLAKNGYRKGFVEGQTKGFQEGKIEGLREGTATTSNAITTMMEVLETNNKHNSEALDKNYSSSTALNTTWQNIVRQKDKQIESYIKENAELKTALEEVDDVFANGVEEVVDGDEADDAVGVAVGTTSPELHNTIFGERTAATTAMELYDQVTAANKVLENIKNGMSQESYRTLKEILQVPGVKNVDIKSSN